jgi:hypothetical protein
MAMPETQPGASISKAPTDVGERGRDSYLRRRGRDFLFAFYGAMRSIKLYPPDNPVVQKTLAELIETAAELLAQERELELRV